MNERADFYAARHRRQRQFDRLEQLRLVRPSPHTPPPGPNSPSVDDFGSSETTCSSCSLPTCGLWASAVIPE